MPAWSRTHCSHAWDFLLLKYSSIRIDFVPRRLRIGPLALFFFSWLQRLKVNDLEFFNQHSCFMDIHGCKLAWLIVSDLVLVEPYTARMVITNSNTPLPTCCTNLKYHWRSMNSGKWKPCMSSGRLKRVQTSCALGQNQNKLPLLLVPKPQASQVESSRIFQWQRLALMESILRQAHHAKFFTLFGTLRPHKNFQNFLQFCPFEPSRLGLDMDERATL